MFLILRHDSCVVFRLWSVMEVGLFVAGCLTFPSLHFLSVRILTLILPRRSKELYLALSTRIVSFLQAVCATCVGAQVVFTCEDNMRDRYLSIYYYAWFGVSYFYYDLGAMFIEAYQYHQKECFVTICKKFISRKWLLVVHHFLLPLFGFPMVVFLRRGIGDFFVGCIYMAEISTPFLSVNAIMSRLGMQGSMLYKINGFLLAITYFFGRIFMFPFMYWSYGRHSKLYIWQVPSRIPLLCNVSCLGLMSLQMVWFVAILKQIAKFVRSSEPSKSSVSVLHANGTMHTDGRVPVVSNGMSRLSNEKHKL